MTRVDGSRLVKRRGVDFSENLSLLKRGDGWGGGVEPSEDDQHPPVFSTVTDAEVVCRGRRKAPIRQPLSLWIYGARARRGHSGNQIGGLLRDIQRVHGFRHEVDERRTCEIARHGAVEGAYQRSSRSGSAEIRHRNQRLAGILLNGALNLLFSGREAQAET